MGTVKYICEKVTRRQNNWLGHRLIITDNPMNAWVFDSEGEAIKAVEEFIRIDTSGVKGFWIIQRVILQPKIYDTNV